MKRAHDVTFLAFFVRSLPCHTCMEMLQSSPHHSQIAFESGSLWFILKNICGCGSAQGCVGMEQAERESVLADSEVGVLLVQQHRCHSSFSSPLPRVSRQNRGQRRFLSS